MVLLIFSMQKCFLIYPISIAIDCNHVMNILLCTVNIDILTKKSPDTLIHLRAHCSWASLKDNGLINHRTVDESHNLKDLCGVLTMRGTQVM